MTREEIENERQDEDVHDARQVEKLCMTTLLKHSSSFSHRDNQLKLAYFSFHTFQFERQVKTVH